MTIYSFESTEPIITQYVLQGIVRNKFTKEPLPNVSMNLYNELKNLVTTIKTDENGFYKLNLLPVRVYALDGEKENFLKNSISIKTPNPDSKLLNSDMVLQPSGILALSGIVTDKQTAVALNNVLIYIKDKNTGLGILKTITVNEGAFEKVLAGIKPGENLNYTIELQKEGYENRELLFFALCYRSYCF